MNAPLKTQLQALHPYLGGKRQLLPWIGSTLAKACPAVDWPSKTFIDLFMGGGAVSFWAKAQGFHHVHANDISQRSAIIANAFLTNNKVRLDKEDVLYLTQPLPIDVSAWIETTYAPSVFSTRHARALDCGFYWAHQHPNPTKQALLLTLMWHLASDFVAFGTSLSTSNRPFAEALDGARSWDEMSAKRFTDGSLKRLCQPAWANLENKRRTISGGVLGGSPVTFTQQDALTILPTLTGDILYLDPPYAGTASYEQSNRVIDALLSGHPLAEETLTSAFSKGTAALEALLQQANHIPIWLLSYGNATVDLETLESMVRSHARSRQVLGFARKYRHLPHVSKNENNQEFLILAYPKEDSSPCP